MSKDRREQAGALLSAEETARNQGTQSNETPPVHGGQNQGAVKKPPVMPSKMTVEQYLKRAPKDAGIGGLLKSLYKTKIMGFDEWENTLKTLLSKRVR